MRKSRAKKRPVLPDPKFQSELVSKFVNNLMKSGKKHLAYQIFYGALEIVEERTSQNGLETFEQALENVMPGVEVKSRRVGGATFQVPIEVKAGRRQALGMRWLIGFSRSRNGRSMREKLAAEIIAAAKGEGAAVKRREDVHRMADANKAFAHFRV
ncbi:MAG: 30S ribosomal protein S7 [Bacteroidia bacterium]